MRLFVDQLTNLDFSYLDKQRGLVGETWLANIELKGKLDHQGMICDFGDVKKTIRNWLDTHIDHKLLIPSTSSALTFKQDNNRDRFDWQCDRGYIQSSAPSEAHCLIPAEAITAESVAEWCINELKPLFPSSVDTLSLHFSIEAIDSPFYHYSHGLKKHGGNCQRIAHGHRSKIEIWENNELSTTLMCSLADEWKDIYIGTEEDCQQDPTHKNNYEFNYTAQQGDFSISLPKEHCYLISTDTTVELIAEHLSTRLKSENPASSFRVKAYEGLAKGAISER